MAKPITNADLFFVIFVAGYIFKWWIDTLQIALVASGRSCIVFSRCKAMLPLLLKLLAPGLLQ
jgi:hypothetical protein